MGKATVDLPDPMQQAPRGNVASADDLLSQLAGDEIDRLLADADIQRPTPTEPSTAQSAQASADAAVAVATAPADELLDLTGTSEPGEVTVLKTPSTPIPPDEAAAVDAALASQLDDLFNALNEGHAPPEPQTLVVPPQADEPATADEPTASDEDLVESAIKTPERSAKKPAAAAEKTDAAAAKRAVKTSKPAAEEGTSSAERNALQSAAPAAAPLLDGIEAEPIPLYLRPLIWINLPMAYVPEVARETVGKVAILTTINALAVLLYVLIFRR